MPRAKPFVDGGIGPDCLGPTARVCEGRASSTLGHSPILRHFTFPGPELFSQTCLETGARISEVTGLRIRHVDLQLGCVHIEQRHCGAEP
jgi:hypothetical protein